MAPLRRRRRRQARAHGFSSLAATAAVAGRVAAVIVSPAAVD